MPTRNWPGLLRLQTRSAAKIAIAETTLNMLSHRTNMALRALRWLVIVACSRAATLTQPANTPNASSRTNHPTSMTARRLDVLMRKQDPESVAFREAVTGAGKVRTRCMWPSLAVG